MMNIDIICVGKIKEKYLKQGIEEYLKRLRNYATVNIIEVSDEPTQDNMSEIEIEQVLTKEADKILQKIEDQRQIIVLAIEGKMLSSEDLAQSIKNYGVYGQSKLAFIIGGSLGLSEVLKTKAKQKISFGKITLPHQLMRLVLVEQIYRAFRIINGHAYHK